MEDNRNVIEAITARLKRCSKGQRKIGEYLLRNYAVASHMTAAKLSETVGVSESTIVRYAVELGYDGYPELQSALKYAARSKLTSVEKMELSGQLGGDTLVDCLTTDAESIRKTLSLINKMDFDAFVTAVMKADRIFIVGARSSASLAMFLNFYLSIKL